MKKLSIIAVTLLAAGAISSWAQVVEEDSISSQAPVTLKAKLSSTKTAVTDTNLSFATVEILNLDYNPIAGDSNTNDSFVIDGVSDTATLNVLGDNLSIAVVIDSNSFAGFVITNQVLQGTIFWIERASVDPGRATHPKFTDAFVQDHGDLVSLATNLLFDAGNGPQSNSDVLGWTAGTAVDSETISNSLLLVTGTSAENASNVIVIAKIAGIWEDGANTVSGSLTSTKEKSGKKK